MKIPVIFIAAVVAVSGSRVVRTFDLDTYRDSPYYFESPPPPLPSSTRSRPPSFLSSFSSSRPDTTYLRDSPSFGDDVPSIFSEGPPSSMSEGKLYFDTASSYFPSSRRPLQNFYRENSFKEESSSGSSSIMASDYRGPPPPMPMIGEDIPRGKPLSLEDGYFSGKHMQSNEPRPSLEQQLHENKGASHEHKQFYELNGPSHEHRTPSLEQQLHDQLQHQMTRMPQELGTQQQQTAPERQPLSFGGHSSHLSYGNHGLGFASVAAGSPDTSTNQVSGGYHSLGFASIANSPDLNPVALAEMTSTTRMNPTSTISIEKHQQQMGNGIEVSQRQPVTSSPLPEASTPSAMSTSAATSSTSSTMRDSESTVPTSTPKSNLQDSIQSTQNQRPAAGPPSPPSSSIMFQQGPPGTSYNFGTITQEYPPIAHGQLPIEPARQQPDYKQNLIFYETKSSYPFVQSQPQLQQQQQSSSDTGGNNATPVRFSIPTVPIASIASTGATAAHALAAGPTKFVIQGALDLSRTPLALAAVPNSNAYIPGQNHLEVPQSEKSSAVTNTVSNLPTYYFVQSSEQPNSAATASQGVPLGSFYLMPSAEQPKQTLQTNSALSQGSFYYLPSNEQSQQTVQTSSGSPQQGGGLQLQLASAGGFGGVEYISSPGNSESMRVEIGKAGGAAAASLQEHLRSLEPTYAKLQNGQVHW